MKSGPAQHIAIVGAGIAGATCAQALALAGHSVQVFDKSRGPGGRLATRRVDWADQLGRACTTSLDHGAVGLSARSEGFRRFVDDAEHAGWMARWSPDLAPGSLPLDDGLTLHVPVPDMPELCRRLLSGSGANWSCTVDSIRRGPRGWQLQAGAEIGDTGFDAIVLALPPAQAAPLLGPHRPDWARHAAMVPMQPCWTLMGIADDPTPAVGQARDGGPDWALARPATGALAWVLRSDARPGRVRVPGQAHWVAHARAGWSRRHLEQPPEWVRQQLQAELAETLGRPIDWLHSSVHRWRYAQPQSPHGSSAAGCWWDPVQRLGVCGDFFGGCGVEGAWQSAQSMALALTQGVDADADLARAVSAPEADLSRLSPRAVGRVT